MEKKSWKRPAPEILREAKSLRKKGYSYRSITALTGLPTTMLEYLFHKEMRRATMRKYLAKQEPEARELRLARMREYSRERYAKKRGQSSLGN